MMLFAGTAMAAGPLEMGVKAGLNSANFDFNKSQLGDSYRAFSKAHTGYHAGVWMRVGLAGIMVQPEFLYNWNRYDMKLWEVGDGAETSSKIRVQTFEVPVMAGWRLLFLRLNAGPVFNIMNKTSHSGGRVERAEVTKPSVSYAAGLGLDIMKVSFDLRYNGNFERAKQAVTVAGQEYKLGTNFRGWTFGLGWRF